MSPRDLSPRNSNDHVRMNPSPDYTREPKPELSDLEAEAGRAELPRDRNLDHEYSVPSTIKFAWLGTYFFFSLLLTLYNKLVLGMVSFDVPATQWKLLDTFCRPGIYPPGFSTQIGSGLS